MRLADLQIIDQSDPNFVYGRSASKNARPFSGLVVHHTADKPIQNLVNYGKTVDQQRGGAFGYHFYVGKDGQIIQGAPLDKRTNHIKPPKHRQRKGGGGISNADAVGITLVGGEHGATPAQRDAAARLGQALMAEYNISPDRVFGHGDLQHDRQHQEGAEVVALLRGGGGADTLAGGEGNDRLQALKAELARRKGQAPEGAANQAGGDRLQALKAELARRRGDGVQPDPRDRADVENALGQLDAMDAPPAEPGFAQQVVDYVGDNAGAAVQAVGDFAVDNAQQFVEGARRGFGAMTNEFYSGGQRVDPSKVDLSTSIGFLEQEVGGEPYVLIPGLDGSPDQKLPVSKFSGQDFITQVDPQSGRTLVLPRTPEATETSGILNAGRVLAPAMVAATPGGSVGGASAPVPRAASNAAQGARAAQRLGVTPSFGASGSGVAGRAASVGADSMITTGPFTRDAGRFVDEIDAAREGVASTVGTGVAVENAGAALKQGAIRFQSENLLPGGRSSQLYGIVDQRMPADIPVSLPNTGARVVEFLTEFPNLPNTSASLGARKWMDLAEDIANAPNGQITWRELSALRSKVGAEIGALKSGKTGAMGDRQEAQIKAIYEALTEDMTAAVISSGGPGALMAWTKANNHYRRARAVESEALNIILPDRVSPEKAYESLLALGKDKGQGANIAKLRKIKGTMPEESWRAVVSTVVRRMGGEGDAFSPAKFVTEWGKLSDPAKAVLFSGRKVPTGLRQAMEDLVRVSEKSKGAQKLLNNSNSGANLTNVGTGVGVTGAFAQALYGNIIPIAMAGAGVAIARISASGMTNPGFLRVVRDFVAAGGSRAATRKLARFIRDNPEVAVLPAVASRNSQGTAEAQPE